MTNTTCTVIDTPEGIAFAQLLALRSALNLEINTGMKMSRGISPLKVAKHLFETNFRNKQAALDHLNIILAEFDARK